MSVNLLRKKLNERELDYDGSREIMIQRLEKWDVENNQQESPQAAPIARSFWEQNPGQISGVLSSGRLSEDVCFCGGEDRALWLASGIDCH